MVTFVSKIYDEKIELLHIIWEIYGHFFVLGTMGIRRGVFVLIIDSRFRGNDGMELIFHG